MSDLDEFRATYFDECAELLTELEEQFAAIEAGDRDADRLHAVFRAIHSIKGGAGAFGFTRLVEFAHSFETLLDLVRDGRVEMSDELALLCLKSNDIVADFVAAAREGTELAADYGAEELARFNAIASGDQAPGDDEPMEEFDIDFTPVLVDLDELRGDRDGGEAVVAVDTQPGEGESEGTEEDSFEEAPMEAAPAHWEIRFRPFPQLYERANDPLLLFRELATLGPLTVRARLLDLPDLADFEAFGVYCYWELSLDAPDAGEAQIREVFEFVEGDCEIEIARAGGLGSVEPTDPPVPTETTPGAPAVADRAAEAAITEPPADPQNAENEQAMPSFAELAAEIAPAQSAPAKTRTEEAPVAAKAEPAGSEGQSSSGAGGRSGGVQSIRVDLDKVDRVVNMVGELVITQSMLTQQMDDTLKTRYQELVRGVEVLAQTTRGLQDAVMAIRAQPVKSVFSRMPRLVRELSSKTGKKMRLEMVGEHTEIDKTIIEQLSDPLTHMIRNSADHGIEKPEKRAAAGKPEHGTILLSAEQSGGSIVITVQDDGGGINRERVLQLARERGVVGPDQQLTDEQIDELIFAPGFSTAEELSDISGRGVGMDVVVSNIKKIGGSVHARSWPGKGTRMQLRLPLTLAVLDVMLVEVSGAPYVIPLSSIVETMQSRRAEFGRTPSGRRVLEVRGDYVQVVDLAGRFDLMPGHAEDQRFVVLCEADGDTKVAIEVDDIIGQQQVVIKSLEENFERIEGIAGGTILGDGSVALIVDVQGIRNGTDQKVAA